MSPCYGVAQVSPGASEYIEENSSTASRIELFRSNSDIPNSPTIFSVLISTDVPSPLGKYNKLNNGIVALVVPEDAHVMYDQIIVYGSEYQTGNLFQKIDLNSDAQNVWWKIIEIAVSEIPYLGYLTLMNDMQSNEAPDFSKELDLNDYDLVNVMWNAPRLRTLRRVQIDIPVNTNENERVGLFAYWRSTAFNDNGPQFTKENVVRPGLKLNHSNPNISSIIIGNSEIELEDGPIIKFTNGAWRDEELPAEGLVDSILQIPWTGYANRYIISLYGCWAGGNTCYYCLAMGEIIGDKFRQIPMISDDGLGISGPPPLGVELTGHKISYDRLLDANNGILTTEKYLWTRDDSHCCPSYKLTRTWRYSNGRFNIISGTLTKEHY